MTPLGQETIDVYSKGTPPMQNRSGQERLATTLNLLLKVLLYPILRLARSIPDRARKKLETADGRFNRRHGLECLQVIDACGEIFCQVDLPFNHLGIADTAHELEGNPMPQRIESSCSHLDVATK